MTDDILDKLLDVQRETTGKSATGAVTRDYRWDVRHRSVPCTLWPATSETRDQFSRPDQVAEFEFATAVDIQAAPQDRIVCEGRTYAVLGYKPFDNAAFDEPVFVTVCGRRNQTSPPAP